MLDCGFADAIGIRGGHIDVARAFLLVPEMPLTLEKPQHPADSRVGWRVWKICQYLGGICSSAPVDDVHDLSLTATELLESAVLHQHLRHRRRTVGFRFESPCATNVALTLCQCIDTMSIGWHHLFEDYYVHPSPEIQLLRSLAILVIATALPLKAQELDTARALSALRDAKAACEMDAGKLWGR